MAEEKAVQFLRSLDIKTTAFGGFDKVATFEKFKEFAGIYESIIKDIRQKESEPYIENEVSNGLLAAVEKERDALKKENEELRQTLNTLESYPEKAGKESSFINILDEISGRLDQLRSEEASVRKKCERIVLEAENEAKQIRADSEKEAEGIRRSIESERENIVKSAREEALRRKAELSAEIMSLRKEKETVLQEMGFIQDQLSEAIRNCEQGLNK